MNSDKWTHPIYVENGATTPRNYKPLARTSGDRMHDYTRAAMKQGKTVGDILAECLVARLRRDLSAE